MAKAADGNMSFGNMLNLGRTWKRFKLQKRRELARFLVALHQFPYNGIVVDDKRTAMILSKLVEQRYHEFVTATRALATLLHNREDGEYLLGPRIFEIESFEQHYALRFLEETMPLLIKLPMVASPTVRQPRERPNGHARAIALAVGWHMREREGGRFRGTYDPENGAPTSAEAIILADTIAAFGLKTGGLESIHREARERIFSKDKPVKEWDIFQEFGVAFST